MKPITGYTVTTEVIDFCGREMTLTNRTPIFSSKEEREKRKREIEGQLYEAFVSIKSKEN